MQSPGLGNSVQTNAGARMKGTTANKPQTIVSPSVGNGVTRTGETINRVDPDVALSAKFTTSIEATMESGHTLTVRRRVEHMEPASAGGDDQWAEPSTNVFDQPDDVVIDADDSGAAVVSSLELDVDLSGFKSNVRIKHTGTLSVTGADSALIACTATLAGYDTAPPA